MFKQKTQTIKELVFLLISHINGRINHCWFMNKRTKMSKKQLDKLKMLSGWGTRGSS